jgi:Baseplate J-like protein
VTTQLYCPDDARRDLVHGSALNGIDFLEVLASQRTLLVHCFKPLPAPSSANALTPDHVVIEGGVRVRDIGAEWALRADAVTQPRVRADEWPAIDGLADKTRVLVVRTTSSGDFSAYTLRLVASQAERDEPPPGFDPLLAAAGFSFKVDCPSPFDCAVPVECEEPEWPAPQIDYLAKDYASFRRLIFDRLSVLVPDWQDRSPADAMVALVELLAYSADSLSYFQDAAATEAYLGTARRRASVRRHARLVDYAMHDGGSARAWVVLEVCAGADRETLPQGTTVLTGEVGASADIAPRDVPQALSGGAVAFETVHALELRESRNEIELYTWGDDTCCLPRGATRATLAGTQATLALRKGDVLLLEEVRDPKSGEEADADLAHRHAVRLSAAPRPRVDDLTQPPTELLEVQWYADDALPFAARLTTDEGERACVARGNVVLADHGATIVDPETGEPEYELLGEPVAGRRFRPSLKRTGVTQAQPYREEKARAEAAAAAMRVDPRRALPAVAVLDGEGERWEPKCELLNSDRFANDFVVELEHDGRALLRFGDGTVGREPTPEVKVHASYRVGSGRVGNVGAEALTRVASELDVTRVRNPLPAVGGTDPEPADLVRLYAPQSFRTQKRAVTAADYATFAERHPEVQKAGATRRWTGSWYTMFVTVDRLGGREIDDPFEDELRAFLDPFRLAGYDLEIDAPHFVPLDLAMTVCVADGYVRSTVKAALLETFGAGTLSGGRRGFFHPDNFTFGEPVYLSRIVAAAMGVPGVEWVEVTRFHRFGAKPGSEFADGEIAFGRLEIARLDNDPNRPENGRIEVDVKGGV